MALISLQQQFGLLFLITSSVASADFSIDLGPTEIHKELELLTVNDLAVGETGIVQYSWSNLCTMPENFLGMVAFSELESERSEYGTYFHVSRLPNSKVSIKILESVDRSVAGMKMPSESKADKIARIAKGIHMLFPCPEKAFVVESIEGVGSISGLLSLIDEGPEERSENSTTSSKDELTTAESEQTWMIFEDRSEIDDSERVRMMLRANNRVYSSFGTPISPTLNIRCEENKTEMYINTSQSLENTDLIVRLDDNNAHTSQMSKSTDGEALFFPNPIGVIKTFFGHQQLVVRYTPFRSAPKTVSFSIENLEKEITPLRKACNW